LKGSGAIRILGEGWSSCADYRAAAKNRAKRLLSEDLNAGQVIEGVKIVNGLLAAT
jgi:predicted nucleic acid-binding protein